MNIEGYIEIDAGLFAPGVLERGLRAFYDGVSPVVWDRRGDQVLGSVTKIRGQGQRVEITATLTAPPPRTELRNVFNQIGSRTIRGLAIVGDFRRDRADIQAISAVTIPIDGSGYIEKVSAQ